jgi:hypothetical protein
MPDRELPAPWQWLSDVEPEPGQQCEWVMLAPWGPDKGAGPWKVIGDGIDLPRFYMPDVVIKGFEDDKGLMVSDPSFTAWMPKPIRSAQSDNSTFQEH